MIDFKYRPDVDGFRAVAVILVLLFHAGLGFTGGYIGVDVFFVVSGYLITGLIFKEQQAGSFQLHNFWIRRIRRIIPASTVMVFVVLVAGSMILLPRYYSNLAESAIWQQLIVSNAHFWLVTGYFDTSADLKPLLHTWSLAVEEQFYLAYPFLLVFLNRFARRWTCLVLSVICILSFLISVISVQVMPSAAFFLLPSRAWELLIGGLIWFAPAPRRLTDRQLSILSWLAVISIVIAAWFYDKNTPFPGFAALLPCAATALIIHVNANRLVGAGRILATRPVVFVGLISYSLYLWHWPILSFLRFRYGEDLEAWVGVSALAASFVLAYLSWRFVETPFRRKSVLKDKKKLVLAACGSTVVVMLASAAVIGTDGMMFRYDKETRQLLTTMEEKEFRHKVVVDDIDEETLPAFGIEGRPAEILVWGDSHAMALMPAIDEVARQLGVAGVQVTHGGTLPLLDFPNNRWWSAPPEHAHRVLAYTQRNQIRLVIIAGFWGRDSAHELFMPSLRSTIDALQGEGCEVLLVMDVPDQGIDPRFEITRGLQTGANLDAIGVALAEHRLREAETNAILESMKGPGVWVIDPAPPLADDDGICHIISEGNCLYWDNHHITISGAMRLVPMFKEAIQRGMQQESDDSDAQRAPGSTSG